jgi:hypothetical protein
MLRLPTGRDAWPGKGALKYAYHRLSESTIINLTKSTTNNPCFGQLCLPVASGCSDHVCSLLAPGREWPGKSIKHARACKAPLGQY